MNYIKRIARWYENGRKESDLFGYDHKEVYHIPKGKGRKSRAETKTGHKYNVIKTKKKMVLASRKINRGK